MFKNTTLVALLALPLTANAKKQTETEPYQVVMADLLSSGDAHGDVYSKSYATPAGVINVACKFSKKKKERMLAFSFATQPDLLFIDQGPDGNLDELVSTQDDGTQVRMPRSMFDEKSFYDFERINDLSMEFIVYGL